jgi:hypothetical protein
MECLNTAAAQCWVKKPVPIAVAIHRLYVLRQMTVSALILIANCPLHGEKGCFCPNNTIYKNTRSEIAAIKTIVINEILNRMILWPEHLRFRIPGDPITPNRVVELYN